MQACTEPKESSSNCENDNIFKNGRWIKKEKGDKCYELKEVKEISLFSNVELWMPDVEVKEPIGTSNDFEGWSYFANERENIQ